MAASTGLVVFSIILSIIGIGLSAAYLAGYIGTTQAEVDARMNECLGYLSEGLGRASSLVDGCYEDAGIYTDVDCEVYSNMPACDKVHEFYDKYWQSSSGGSSISSRETPAAPKSACSPNCELKLIIVNDGSSLSEHLAGDEQIQLLTNGLIRIEAADDGVIRNLQVVAENLEDGDTQTLRKMNESIFSNEYKVNLNGGHYELQVQASWADGTNTAESFDIMVS